MPAVSGIVTEKWSNLRLANIIVSVDGIAMARTNKDGWFAGNVAAGVHKFCIVEEGGQRNYEAACVNVPVTSNMTLNMQMKPIYRAL